MLRDLTYLICLAKVSNLLLITFENTKYGFNIFRHKNKKQSVKYIKVNFKEYFNEYGLCENQ